jgi:hypothetical protein
MILKYSQFVSEGKNPCWSGYRQIGTKIKKGRSVPNCVPVNEKVSELSQTQKDWLDEHTVGTWMVDPSTGLVDIDGDFDCQKSQLGDFIGVSFGVISGDFDFSNGYLTSLKGAPRKVGGLFNCDSNSLTSLEGSPLEIGGDFFCSYNDLTSLNGSPEKVGGGYYCNSNKLKSLEGATQKVDGGFFCQRNQLTSLEGAPQEVDYFWCHYNGIKNLKGSPQIVRGNFNCSDNKLTSLEGAPQEVGGNFYCSFNNLTSLKQIPYSEGNIDLGENPIWDLLSSHWNRIKNMGVGLRNVTLQMIGQLETPKTEDIAMIVRSVERMDMI